MAVWRARATSLITIAFAIQLCSGNQTSTVTISTTSPPVVETTNVIVIDHTDTSTVAIATTSSTTTTAGSTSTDAAEPIEDMLVWALKVSSFIPFLGDDHSVLVAALADPNRAISADNTLATEELYVGKRGSQFWALAADYNRSRIYFTDFSSNHIGVYDMKAKTSRIVFEDLSYGIDGMAVDWFTGNIYWTDTDLRVITVADSEFNYYKHIINITSNVPAKIAINPIKKSLFWSERSTDECRLFKSDLSGNNIVHLHTFADVESIDEMTMDVSENRLYWSERIRDTSSARVRYFNLDNTNEITTIYSSNRGWFMGLASYKEFLYIGNRLDKTIRILNKTSDVALHQYSHRRTQTPRGVVVFSASIQPWTVENHLAHPCADHSCSQLCLTDGPSSHVCACTTGSFLQPDGRSCDVTLIEDDFALLMDAKHGKIYQVPLTDPSAFVSLPLTDVGVPQSVDYDEKTKKIYWADTAGSRIIRSYLNGTEQEVILTDVKTYSIALDQASRNLYIADSDRDAIVVMSLELPSVTSTLHVHDIHRVWKLLISDKLKKVFWSDWGQEVSSDGRTSGVIEEMNLDGTGRKIIANDTRGPQGLTIDHENNILFWTEILFGTIAWMNLNSGERGRYDLQFHKNSFVAELAYHNGYIYLTDHRESNAFRVRVSDVMSKVTAEPDDVEEFGPRVFYDLSGIRIFSSAALNADTNTCSANRSSCPQICVPSQSDRICLCNDHSVFVPSNNTCTQVRPSDDEISPSFGDTCPSFQVLFTDKCSDTSSFNFTAPVATDNSGHVVVKRRLKKPPPYDLLPGSHLFQYTAQDNNGNVEYCTFTVFVIRATCAGLPRFQSGITTSAPSCETKYGSVINITCPGFDKPNFETQCTRSGSWTPNEPIICPTATTTTPTSQNSKTTTTTVPATPGPATTQRTHEPNGATNLPVSAAPEGVNGGVIALIVIVVVFVAVGAGFLVWRYKYHLVLAKKAFWNRADDTVQLTTENGHSPSRSWPSVESNVYI
ncbi:low-density lipoprotein receptor-related protein 1B-like isoform X1 [Clavelina lepadiformis]|uniref:low-density lipoprotein receptor-related protein 1B-like isoform X1 n=1 Tax=Clavelina lepadiformis TaxID=159417 RepID=UPI004042DDA2